MLEQYLNDILGGRLSAEKQDEAHATYAPMINKKDGSINWNQDSAEIDRLIRAMTPWPSAFTSWLGQTLKVLDARPISHLQLPAGPPGTVVAYKNSTVILAGEGGLQLFKVQLAGKRAMEIEEFLRGRPDFAGSYLGEYS
jgi:methionyl-tRNA formyltransferase